MFFIISLNQIRVTCAFVFSKPFIIMCSILDIQYITLFGSRLDESHGEANEYFNCSAAVALTQQNKLVY